MILSTDIALYKGIKFHCTTTGDEFELVGIQEYEVRNGKRTKMSSPLYTFQYLNVDRPNFTNRYEDIRRAHIFKTWIKI